MSIAQQQVLNAPAIEQKPIRRRFRRVMRMLGITMAIAALGGIVTGMIWFQQRYFISPVMDISVREYTNAEYPEDPAARSVHFGQYTGRKLKLVQKDETHFDFIFEPQSSHIATVAFRNVDVALMTPSLPTWCKADDGLERIALTDRQWNRQQVRFDPKSPVVDITGGDGFERDRIHSAELAKNCLNAGLWEVLLFVEEDGTKALYYQGWFTFPLGHYARVFEKNTGISYRKHWYKLEHWSDPTGTSIPLEPLRKVLSEKPVDCRFQRDERIFAAGEQVRKRRTTEAANVVAWRDYYDGRPVTFAAFVPPGKYNLQKPWKNEYSRLANFENAVVREIRSPASDLPLQEIELRFRSQDGLRVARFLVSGVSLKDLPQLPVAKYADGLYMPMGIGVPPFFQTYDKLQEHVPSQSPFFCVLLDDQGKWLNHHDIAVDGPVMHRDENDPSLLHLYLLSYERHTLIGHWIVSLPGQTAVETGG